CAAADRFFGALHPGFDFLGERQKPFATLCQIVTARTLIEELCSESLLQLRDPPAHRCLIHAQALTGARYLPGTGGRKKVSEIVPIHGVSIRNSTAGRNERSCIFA